MSALTNFELSIYLSTFLTAFLGSFHCLGMCGGIVMAVSNLKGGNLFYHLGRLVSYISMGLVAGVIGLKVFDLSQTNLRVISPILVSVVFMILGIQIILGSQFHLKLPDFFSIPYQWSFKKAQTNKSLGFIFSFLLGLFSIALPCGWLYGFIVGAATTSDPIKGMLMMSFFWLGTIPILLLTPHFIQNVLRPLREKYPKTGGIVLICAGILTMIFGILRV